MLKSIIAISGKTKITVYNNLSANEAGKLRFELNVSDDNVDMFGKQVCVYRIKKS